MTTAAAPTSTGRSIAIVTIATTVVASVINTVISLVAQSMGANATVIMGLQPPLYIAFTVIGVLVGSLVWVRIARRAARPSALLGKLVPIVVALTLIPDLLIGIGGLGWTGAIALMLMHIVVATTAVLALRRFVPLPA